MPGFAPPEDALPLDEQIALGIGVPPPSPPLPTLPLVSAQGSVGGGVAGFSASASVGGGVAGGGGGLGVSVGVGFVPPDAPSLSAQAGAAVSASFQPTTPGILALCGIHIPGFSFDLSFSISILLDLSFDFPPSFFFLFALSLNCDLANPIEAKVAYGGGRLPSAIPELDAEFA